MVHALLQTGHRAQDIAIKLEDTRRDVNDMVHGFVIQAGPEFKVLESNKLNEMCMATPAAIQGSLIIRTISKLYRIGRPL